MWTYPKVVAHRGGGRLAPENTLAAMRCGLAHGFHAVEFDVMAVRGDGLVLMHDPQLGRTVTGYGEVADYTVDELTQMDAGAWFGADFIGETVPSFAAVADFCLRHGIWMNVEIKPADGAEVVTGRLVGAACAALPDGAVLLSSFSFAALSAARLAAPSVPRALLVEQVPSDWQAQLQALDALALHTKASLLRAEDAASIKQAGYGLFCYTVNDAAQARTLLAMGVDAFCTDCIDVIGADFCTADLDS
jgi:glycerophosphoryl diester phosphodiesterase